MQAHFKSMVVDGLDTAYYEAGSGETVVLLHGGEHGACSELTWELNFAALAGEFHVLAPDWLGFGRSAKVHDFVLGAQRKLLHLKRFLQEQKVNAAHFIGCSMGGALCARALSVDPTFLPARSLVLIGAGGQAPDNVYRRALLDYDCSLPGMRKIIQALFHDESWAANEAYVKRRYDSSTAPGAWECSAAARFKSPLVPARSEFGQVDTTEYERVTIPVLLIAGARDKLKEPGYASQLSGRFPDCEWHVIPDCGHYANIECASSVNTHLLRFLRRVKR
jgi:2-hydroxymuconate-semialdehyde hydrolase